MTAPDWPRVRLKDLGTWFGGGTPSKSNREFWTDGTVPWVSPKDMGPEVLAGTQDHITQDAVENSSVKRVPAGSVALVVRSGILERTLPVAVVPFDTTLNQDMKAVAARPDIDARWIAWGLRASEQEILRTCRKRGTTVASMEMPRLYEHTIPVPPLDVQRRIVDILEDHLSRLDAAEHGLTTSIARLRHLHQAALDACLKVAAKDPLSSTTTIGELAKVGTGATPLKSQTAYYAGGDIPWVTSADLSQGLIQTATQFVTPVALKETTIKLWPVGTLLVAMYGEGKTRGTTAELCIEATTNQACAAIQLRDPDPSLKSWVRLVLESKYWAMRRMASGGVQPNLNLGLVRSIKIPVPAQDTRERLLLARDAQVEAEQVLASALAVAQRRSLGLRRSLLAAAFSGRLTGRSSDLEIAEELSATAI